MPAQPTVAEVLAAVTAAVPGGGEHRPGQLDMAQAVAHALDSRRHLVVRAGTGTGKTLAYLLPALLAGTPVVVATATRALQDQLATNDLPLVQRALAGHAPVTFAVLKGRANYLCRQRAAEAAGHACWDDFADADTVAPLALAPDGSAAPDSGPPGPEAMALPGLEVAGSAAGGQGPRRPGARRAATVGGGGALVASGATGTGSARVHGGGAADTGDAQVDAAAAGGPTSGGRLAGELRRLLAWARTTDVGDRGELAFEPHPRSWAAVSVGPRECPGAFRCPSGDACLVELARARAAAAQVVVVNTALYTAHLAAEGAVLPPHDVVVFDEAHEVEEIVGRGLGVELTPGRLRAAAVAGRGLVDGPEGEAALAALADGALRLEQMLADVTDQRVRLAPDDRAGRRHEALADLLSLVRGRVDDLARAVRRRDGDGGGPADAAARRQRVLQATSHLADDVATLLDPDRDQVVWAEAAGAGAVLRAAPVEIGPLLASTLWPEVTAVLTSATVPPGVAGRLGLPAERTDHVDVGSPFPYRDATRLYVPLSIGDRRTATSEPAAHDEIVALVEAAGGRTLALFTSWRAMQAATEAVRRRVSVPVLAQGEAPKAALLARFATEEATCLFATMSFWQGIDVPGRSLSVVVIDRLPFPRPDDPLLQARRERAGDGAFAAVDLPRAATLLAQGAGRLVRRASDRGVVAVLDPRLATARYRATLLDALPPMRRTVDRAEVLAFLREVTADPEPATAVPPPA